MFEYLKSTDTIITVYLFSLWQAMTFNQVIQTGPDEEGGDDKAVTAMGILNTIDTLLSVVEDHKEVSSIATKHSAPTHIHTRSAGWSLISAPLHLQKQLWSAVAFLPTHLSHPPTPGNTLCSHHVQNDSEAEADARNSAGAHCHHVCWNIGLRVLEAKKPLDLTKQCFTLRVFDCITVE